MDIRARAKKLKVAMLELAKIIHEVIGIQSPRLFIGVCILLFGIMGGGLGWAIDKGYRTKLAQEQTKVQSTSAPMPLPTPGGPITTDAPCSPVTQGSGNTVTANCEGSTKNAAPKSDR